MSHNSAVSFFAEKSMMLSRTKTLKDLVAYLDQKAQEKQFLGPGCDQIVDYSVFAIIKVKRIKPEVHAQ